MPSEKCKLRLESPPNCTDRKAVLGWVMCHARWHGQEEKKLELGPAMKEAWEQVRRECSVIGNKNPQAR